MPSSTLVRTVSVRFSTTPFKCHCHCQEISKLIAGDWPTPLTRYAADSLVMTALSGIVQYLDELQLTRELLSQKNFHDYSAFEVRTATETERNTDTNTFPRCSYRLRICTGRRISDSGWDGDIKSRDPLLQPRSISILFLVLVFVVLLSVFLFLTASRVRNKARCITCCAAALRPSARGGCGTGSAIPFARLRTSSSALRP